MNNNLCITTFVFGQEFQAYIPLCVYSILRSYPDYYPLIFCHSSLSDATREQLELLSPLGRFSVIENHLQEYKLNNQQGKAIRWTLDHPEFNSFDAVYVGDVDIFIVPEEPALYEQHLGHCQKLDSPYSNALRPVVSKKLPKGLRTIADMLVSVGPLNTLRFIVSKKTENKQLSGLHFFKTKEYLEKIRPLLAKYNKIILNNDYSNRASTIGHKGGFHNECLLYDLVKESGMPLPPDGAYSIDPKDFEQPCFRPHHGLHLGIFRKQSTIDNSKATLDSQCYKDYYKKYCDMTKNDPVFASLEKFFSDDLKELLSRMHSYYASKKLLMNNKNTQRPLKVLHVLTVMDTGGVETRLMELMRHIDRDEVQFDVCVHKNWKGYYDDELETLGGKIVNCGPLKNLPVFCFRFYMMLRRSDYDVVHSHVPTFSAICLTLAKWAGVKKRIAHLRNVVDPRDTSFVHKVVRKTITLSILRNATNIIGITKTVLRSWFGKNWDQNKKLCPIYNGIDTEPYRCASEPDQLKADFNIPSDHKVIVHVGRFHPQKNHVKLVNVAAAFLARNEKACFVLVGDGELKTQIEESVNAKGLMANFRFVGVRNDVARIMKASDAFLFPSAWEGLGGVVQEAIAAGLPMVVSKIEPIEEVLSVCGNAEVLSLSDTDDKWADALEKAVNTPKQDQWLKELEDSPFAIDNAWQELLAVYLKS